MPKDEYMEGADVSRLASISGHSRFHSILFQGSTDGVNTPASGEELSSSVDDSPPAKMARTEEDSGEYHDFRRVVLGPGFLYVAAIYIPISIYK